MSELITSIKLLNRVVVYGSPGAKVGEVLDVPADVAQDLVLAGNAEVTTAAPTGKTKAKVGSKLDDDES